MTIKYCIEENKLKPGTFYARVIRGEAVGLDDMIPNVVAKTSLTGTDLKGAISALTEEIVAALAAGNTVVIDGLVTLYVSLSGSFDTPDHVITRETAQPNIVAQGARSLKNAVASGASYSQEVPGVKSPVIRSVFDTVSLGYDQYTPAAVVRLTGDNLKFDPAQPDEGVFVSNDVAEVRLPIYSSIGKRRIDVIIPVGTGGTLTVAVRARYTPGGELRQTTYRRPVALAGS